MKRTGLLLGLAALTLLGAAGLAASDDCKGKCQVKQKACYWDAAIANSNCVRGVDNWRAWCHHYVDGLQQCYEGYCTREACDGEYSAGLYRCQKMNNDYIASCNGSYAKCVATYCQ